MSAINAGVRRRKTRRVVLASGGVLAVVIGGVIALAQGPATPGIGPVGPGESEPKVEQTEPTESFDPAEATPEELRAELERLQQEFDSAVATLEQARIAEAEVTARQEAGEDVEDERLAIKATRQEWTTQVRSLATEKSAVEARLFELGLLDDPIVAAREAVTDEDERMVHGMTPAILFEGGAELEHLFGEQLVFGVGTEIVEVREDTANAGAYFTAELDGENSVQSLLASQRVTQLLAGEHPHCAGAPKSPPDGFEGHRRLSIQPVDYVSCLQWWTIDLFLNDDGKIEAVTIDFWEQ